MVSFAEETLAVDDLVDAPLVDVVGAAVPVVVVGVGEVADELLAADGVAAGVVLRVLDAPADLVPLPQPARITAPTSVAIAIALGMVAVIRVSLKNLLQEPWVMSPAWEGWAETAE